MISFAVITAAFCILLAAVKSTAKNDADFWNLKQKFLIRTAAVLPLTFGLVLYYSIISSNEWDVSLPVLFLLSFLFLGYAFVLARLNRTTTLITWLLSILLTFLFILIFVFTLQPLLLPFIAFGAAYTWFVGEGLFRS